MMSYIQCLVNVSLHTPHKKRKVYLTGCCMPHETCSKTWKWRINVVHHFHTNFSTTWSSWSHHSTPVKCSNVNSEPWAQ